MSVRTATPEDLAAIEQLLGEADLPTAGVAEILTEHPEDFLVAELNETRRRLVGVAGLEVRGDNALLRSVAVAPGQRRSGTGRELVCRIVEYAEGRGLNALYLLTTTAERYFPRFGFERTDRADVPEAIACTVEFQSACPASAVAMKKLLGSGRAL